ncbi:dihydroneopterin aldolase [Sulfoacidibacillus ferrooxidans]|uniref:7,8-dihydroneopterin aldolase n=1 Tax=Sulfoacidibacillus ferrooxidans TaxID=2005001 RepID=A0A9X1VA69_9BACL|nr:dihydroneopterin aldolase [Sulfoacidibacillus ferrooxidans]MCI0183560.1 Dihydroneopterin aldolase [Sulfoacidibacillus ferrooxidans]
MADVIFIRDMEFFGYHGVFTEEQRLGQRFVISLRLLCDLEPAALHDDLTLTVDYGDVYNRVKEVVEGRKRKLVESVAQDIANTVLRCYPIVHTVVVHMEKPGAPIAGIFETVGVEIERSRTHHSYMGE